VKLSFKEYKVSSGVSGIFTTIGHHLTRAIIITGRESITAGQRILKIFPNQRFCIWKRTAGNMKE